MTSLGPTTGDVLVSGSRWSERLSNARSSCCWCQRHSTKRKSANSVWRFPRAARGGSRGQADFRPRTCQPVSGPGDSALRARTVFSVLCTSQGIQPRTRHVAGASCLPVR